MPKASGIFSTPTQLSEIAAILKNYVRLPFSSINIPGSVMEGILGHVRQAEVLRTYDFVDVVDREKSVGWQIKSTLADTPVTWKRAKIPDAMDLIRESDRGKSGCQALGNAIIHFCNDHAARSLSTFKLKEIGYARLILHKDGDATYFERLLCSIDSPAIFDPSEFTWKWSSAKKTKTKEQLTALHGIHLPSQKKWFAWHGRGENQLHFNGERSWWPDIGSEHHARKFRLPSTNERLSLEQFIDLISASSNPLPPA